MAVLHELATARRCLESGDCRQAEAAYRRVLDADPHNKDALHGLGVLAIKADNNADAVEYLRRAIAADGADAALHNHLGVALAGLEQFDQARESLQRAIELDPRQADAYYNLAKVLQSVEQSDEAVTHYRAALEIDPNDPKVHYNLANTLRDLGRRDEAVVSYQQALRLRPGYLKAHNNLGNVFRDQGRLEEAAAMHRRAIGLKPDYAEAHHNLGLVLRSQEKLDEAVAAYRRALQIKPDFTAARNSLCKALIDQKQFDEAETLLKSMPEEDESSIEARLQMAEKLRGGGRLDEAAACLEKVLQFKSDLAAAHHNLGLVRFAKGELDRAVTSYRRSLQIKPDFAEAHNNLAIALQTQSDFPEALKHIEIALRIQPDFAVAHLNRSVAWLRMGQFRRGWQEFEWRRLCEDHRLPRLPAPLWDGEPLPDGTILLHAEQGLGDTMQFVRYAPIVRQRCGKLILQCQKPLQQLLAQCRGIDQLVVRGEKPPPFDAHAPLMSLPLILGTTLETVPAEVPYVSVEEQLVSRWRERLDAHRGFKVGIAWQGSTHYNADNYRSIPLRHFAPLAEVAGVQLFSLQTGEGSEQLAELAGEFPVTDFGPEFDRTSGPFMDTAAVMKSLDLVISSDTAIVHLAGALGVPVWMMLTSSADWRWLDRRSDSPWYPTMRLFRQTRLDDWNELFDRAAGELAEVVEGNAEKLPAPPPCSSAVHAPIRPGELLDRIAILEIKCGRIADQDRLRHVEDELQRLIAVRDQLLKPPAELAALASELDAVNRELWDIEDEIRVCETQKDFGSRFVELARAVYLTNDRRAAIKRKIDVLSGSPWMEEKVYRQDK